MEASTHIQIYFFVFKNTTFFLIVKYKAIQTDLKKKISITYYLTTQKELHLGGYSTVLIFERDNENMISSFPLEKG